MSYRIGAVEVAVNPVTAAQVAPPGAATPAAAAVVEAQSDAKKEELRRAKQAGGGGIDGKVILLGVALLGLGAFAMWEKKGKKKSSGGHVIAGR